MKKRIFWMVLVAMLSVALCVGCGQDSKGGGDGEEAGNIDDRDEEESGYAYFCKEYGDSVMLTASNVNAGLVNFEDNYWDSTHWSVTYDGQVECYSVYHLDGEQEKVDYRLSEEEMQQIWEILDGKLKKDEEDYDSACDGDTWSIAYYEGDSEEMKHSYNGYIYGKEPLEEIAEILKESRNTALADAGIDYDPSAVTGATDGPDDASEGGIWYNTDRGDAEICVNPAAAEYDEEQLREGYINYSIDLLKESVADGTNSMISPLSVMMALDMAAAGAEGSTQDQITRLFCPGVSQAQLENYCNDLMESYHSDEDVELHIANSLWINDEFAGEMNTQYLDRANRVFDAVAKVLPFDNAAVDEINGWVDENTNGMIDNLLNSIPSDAVLYLINATAVEAPWAEPYEDGQVWEDVFTDAAGRTQSVEMMHSTEADYFETEDAVGFLKYYEGGEYGFLTVLPREGMTVEEYLADMTGESYREFYDTRTGAYKVHTMMPKFTYEYELTMNGALRTLGVTDAFDEALADFSGIAEPVNGNLYIDQVLHKTFIEVGQYETRAAAVTGIMFAATSMPIEEEYREVYLNRPFIYAIVEVETGTPLFIGTLQTVEQ